MNSTALENFSVDGLSNREISGQGTSNWFQAASSIERGQPRSSESHTISQVDSSVSSMLRPPKETEAVETVNQPNSISNPIISVADSHSTSAKSQIEEADPCDAWAQKIVLALDGGGIRGFASLLILQYLMHRIAHFERPKAENSFHPLMPPRPIPEASVQLPQHYLTISGEMEEGHLQRSSQYLPSHYFDYIAGTSTGGLSAIMLGRFSMPVIECLRVYEDFGNEVFKNARIWHIRNIRKRSLLWSTKNKYNTARVKDFFMRKVREYEPSGLSNFPQEHPDMCRTIVIATRRDISTDSFTPHLFRSYPHPSHAGLSNDNGLHCPQILGDNFPIWQIARATTAAPSYFRAVRLDVGDADFDLIDGGLSANCPSEQVCRSIQELGNDRFKCVGALLSIGTGKPPSTSRRNKAIVKLTDSNLRGLLTLVGTSLKQATNAEIIHQKVKEQMRREDVPYFRLNAEDDLSSIKLDAFKGKNGEKTLGKIIDSTRKYLATQEIKDEIDRVARFLVARRRIRAYKQEQPSSNPAQTQRANDAISPTSNPAPNPAPDYIPPATEKWHERWEIFVFGVKYACKISGSCGWTREKLETRQELQDHYVTKHRLRQGSAELEQALDNAKRYPIRELAANNRSE